MADNEVDVEIGDAPVVVIENQWIFQMVALFLTFERDGDLLVDAFILDDLNSFDENAFWIYFALTVANGIVVPIIYSVVRMMQCYAKDETEMGDSFILRLASSIPVIRHLIALVDVDAPSVRILYKSFAQTNMLSDVPQFMVLAFYGRFLPAAIIKAVIVIGAMLFKISTYIKAVADSTPPPHPLSPTNNDFIEWLRPPVLIGFLAVWSTGFTCALLLTVEHGVYFVYLLLFGFVVAGWVMHKPSGGALFKPLAAKATMCSVFTVSSFVLIVVLERPSAGFYGACGIQVIVACLVILGALAVSFSTSFTRVTDCLKRGTAGARAGRR